MARKELIYTTDANSGRDSNKTFYLHEMAASRGEKWAIRAIGAMLNAGIELPDDIRGVGMAEMAVIGFKAFARVPFEQAEPLLDELMGCVLIIPDANRPEVKRGLIESDIEEIATRGKIRLEVFKLHVDFFTNEKEPASA